MSEIEVSIIIVSYNTQAILSDCLKSIQEANLTYNYEIIIVDNASEDSTVLMIEKYFPRIILIKNKINLMFSKANNIGIKNASGKYVLLLNSDTLIDKGELEKLINFLNQNPLVSAVGPRILNFDGTIQSESFPFDSLHNLFSNYLKILHWPIPMSLKSKILPKGFIGLQNGITRKTGWISGCCILINKDKLLNKIGFLDEDLLFYGEDVEWCYRANKRNESVYIFPDSHIIHLGGASTNGEVLLKIRENTLNNYIKFLIKTIGPVEIFLINVITLLIHLIFSPLVPLTSEIRFNKWKKNIVISIYTIKYLIKLYSYNQFFNKSNS